MCVSGTGESHYRSRIHWATAFKQSRSSLPSRAGAILRAIPHNSGLRTPILQHSDDAIVTYSIGLIVFVVVFGGALIGMYMRVSLHIGQAGHILRAIPNH
jgi:hypothetical protein